MQWPLVKRSAFDALKEESDAYRLALRAIDNIIYNHPGGGVPEAAVVEMVNILHITMVTHD